MKDHFGFFKTNPPPSRHSDFYLGCHEGAVFMNFNCTAQQCIYLKSISFDGYGYCDQPLEAHQLSPRDSERFRLEMRKDPLDQKVVGELVYQLIQLNRRQIWSDALAEYGWGSE